MQDRITRIQGTMIPIYGEDVDTDRIIAARYMKALDFSQLAKFVFIDERESFSARNEIHPMDDPRYADASILVVGRNFGCGSSREHAVQALKRWGIQAIIGESFGEIFRGNSVSAGMPCFTVSSDQRAELQNWIENHAGSEVEIDLQNSQLRWEKQSVSLEMPDGMLKRFTSGGWNKLGRLRNAESLIQGVASKLPYMHWKKEMDVA